MMGTNGVQYQYQYANFVGNSGMAYPYRRNESFLDHATEFGKAMMEMSVEFGKGCRDIVWQSLGREDSYLGRRFRRIKGPCANFCAKFRFFNEYLPEDKDPLHAWSVICFVSVLALSGKIRVKFVFCWSENEGNEFFFIILLFFMFFTHKWKIFFFLFLFGGALCSEKM